MKSLFHITGSSTITDDPLLLIRIGSDHVAFANCDRRTFSLLELAYCSIEYPDATALEWLIVTHPSLKKHGNVVVGLDLDEGLLIPSMNIDKEVVQELTGTIVGRPIESRVVRSTVPGWQVDSAFVLNNELDNWLQHHFPSAKIIHQSELDLRNSSTIDNAAHINVDIREHDMHLSVTNNNRLLLSRNFAYSTPVDVLYHLLNCCEQFSLTQETVNLHLSGLVDRDSALFSELQQYFLNVSFREADWGTAASIYPAHFFTSLNDLVQCV